MTRSILTIDQGTTSSRAILFDPEGNSLGVAQKEFTQHFPADGWVEHDPEEIWGSTEEVVRRVVADTGTDPHDIVACGITNQRETTLIWERATGRPIHNAVVWQDRRTADLCTKLKEEDLEQLFTDRTGLLLDPYFSGTKIRWLLDHVDGARARAERGELAFGTVDTFLLWRLTGGRAHKTDATNASRTLLYNIHTQEWDEELCRILDVPLALLPEVEDSSADFGTIEELFPGNAIPVCGIAGDQQSALIGQCCFTPGMTKSTYGTGCFLIMNTGDAAVSSSNKLLTTVAYRLDGRVTYGIEGSIFIAGAAVQWLRDGLGLVKHAAETEAIARERGDAGGVYLVPAFTGLGAPHWDPAARGALLGMTRDTGVAEIVTATLQSVGYQTRDLLEAMASDGSRPTLLRVDGGMVANDWVTQFLADILDIPVDRPRFTETTALGACFLAGLRSGVYSSLESISGIWQGERRFLPAMEERQRETLYGGWQGAVARVKSAAAGM